MEGKMANFLCTMVLILLLEGAIASKYSQEKNRHPDKPFRMNKHNLLWQKAQGKLSDTKLESLRLELKKLDKIAMELKHSQAENGDLMGDLEAEARQRFIDITEKYGLVTNEINDKQHAKNSGFDHAKVKNLWEKALYEGSFKPEELAELKKELEHHEKKIKEYKVLSELIDKHDSISDNDIDSFDRPDKVELKMKKRELKDKFHDINKHYASLNDKVQQRLPSPVDDFRDVRVIELWRKANQLGFSEEELKSIQEELKHFQLRIDKMNHWKEEHEKVVKSGKDQDDSFKYTADKLKEHGKLVKKYHATMIDRVFKREEL